METNDSVYRVNWQDTSDSIIVADYVQLPRENNATVFFNRDGKLLLAANWDSVYSIERLTDDEVADLVAQKNAKMLLGRLYVELSKRVDAGVQVGTTEDEPARDGQVPVA